MRSKGKLSKLGTPEAEPARVTAGRRRRESRAAAQASAHARNAASGRSPWSEARERRRSGRVLVAPQPRSPLGFIMKQVEGHTVHVWDTRRAFETAISRHEVVAEEAPARAMAKKQGEQKRARKRKESSR